PQDKLNSVLYCYGSNRVRLTCNRHTVFSSSDIKSASVKTTMSAAKPQLRYLFRTEVLRDIFVAIGVGLVGGLVFRYTVQVPRIRNYENFYKNYNANDEALKLEKERDA
ncbi:hypothetical protein TrispH2_001472, partial [Trichoplax sp. H2]